MASNQKEKEESFDVYTCYICRLQVSLESKRSHKGSYLHQATLKIASAALERLRTHVAPISESAKEPVEPSQEKQHTDASSVSFCGSCASVFPSFEHAKHVRSKTHLMAALDDQVFEELVRGYVDEEELQFLEGISKDPCDDEERAVDESEATDTYSCNMCALDIPKAFKNEHEQSSRHRACLAIANAASQRTIAFLTPTPIRVDTPTRTLEDKMVALLKVYTGVDIKKQEHIETEEEIEVAKDKTREVKKRLTPKEYFTEIMPFIQYIGGFYTLLIDDTDYVTIKTEKDTYLRVHVGNFSGLYNIGSTEEYQMKCKMCDGYDMNVSYSSKGNIDKLHIMSLGHIKNVLTPITSIHGIRKIDNTHSLCVLCNAFIPTHSVEEHIMRGIQHTAFLAEALEKGRNFKENDNDMKFIIYTAPPVEKLGFFMKQSPPNFNSVLKPRYSVFGQKSPGSTGFGQSTTFGKSAGQSASQQASSQPFGKSGTFGNRGTFGSSGTFGNSETFGSSGTFGENQSTLYGTGQSASNQSSEKAAFGQNSGTGFGQINQPMNLNSAAQPTTSQSVGNGGTFGLRTGIGFGQSTGTGFGQSTGTGFGQSTGTGFGQGTGTGFGQSTGTGFGQCTGTGFGQSTGTGFGQGTGTGFGQSTGTGFGQSTGTGFGQSTGTGFGQSTGTGFGQSNTEADVNSSPQPTSVPFGQNIAQTTKQSNGQASNEESVD